MTDKVIRLFKILLAIQSNPGISAKELADKCETTDRTIYRDLRILDLIAPITNEGYGKGYRFVGNFAMYPLNFTEQEALVFSVLPSVLDTSKLPPGFESAYDKVMATHVKETRKRYDTLENVAGMTKWAPRLIGRTVPTSCCPSWKRSSPVRRSGLFTIPRAGMN